MLPVSAIPVSEAVATPPTPLPVLEAALVLVSDAELLATFVDRRDDVAFRRLLERFSPLVFSVALRLLGDRHTTEDVFQAVFLVLARDAHQIRQGHSLAAWLHGVTLRIARKVLSKRKREVQRKAMLPVLKSSTVLDDLQQQYQLQLLEEELQRLPQGYREALILHFLEGKTCEETAAALATSVGAIRGRIQRGKSLLRSRLLIRGVELSATLMALSLWQLVSSTPAPWSLLEATLQGSMTFLGSSSPGSHCSQTSLQLAQETTMFQSSISLTVGKVLVAAIILLGGTAFVWSTQAQQPTALTPVIESRVSVTPETSAPLELAQAPTTPSAKEVAATIPRVAKYHDGTPDGKKSVAGTGEAILFELPAASQKLASIRMHCGRYGRPQAPDEDVEVTIMAEDEMTIVHTEMVPYSKFKRGDCSWHTIAFEEPVTVPGKFWVNVQFNAEQTKGVYVSYDASSGGQHSRTGLPGAKSEAVSFGGDWMIEAVLTKPE